MKLKIILLALLSFSVHLQAQNTKRVLFLGNSYTYFNDLPQMTANMAASVGKTLIFDSNSPGSYYLGQHATNPTSLAKIQAGNWDNVVLQEQSMALAYPGYFMNSIGSSIKMDSIVKAHNPCAQTLFYGTWGRKNGDTYLCSQPYCEVNTVITRTFYQMNSDIQAHYKIFADSLKASMSPVSAVWSNIRQQNPSIELFDPDESHPSLAGTYAAACTFYAAIFRSDPTQITFNAGLSDTDAENIRLVAKQVVYNNLSGWNIGPFDNLLDSSCLALDSEEFAFGYWNISPNPVSDILTVRLSANHHSDLLTLYNIFGELVKKIDISQTITTINLSELPSGVYILKSTNTQSTFKVLKK